MRKSLWHDFLRIWAQWLAVGLASIPAGITLGILLRNGVGRNVALIISLLFGLLLTLFFWVLIDRRLTPRVSQASLNVSSISEPTLSGVVIELRESDGNPYSSLALAAVMLISIYSYQQSAPTNVVPSMSSNAIPQL